jgi:predicted enzyme related to lactoylglutathione lyase
VKSSVQTAEVLPEPIAEAELDEGVRLLRAEKPVARLGRAITVVPSVRPSHKAWRKLGFALSDAFEFMGCTAFDLVLSGCGVRFVAVPKRPEINPLTTAIGELLEKGAGLLGWSWACQSVHRSRDVIEARAGSDFESGHGGRKSIVVPRKLTPGATTLLEPLVHEEVPHHPNSVTGLDHLVIAVTDVEAAADSYERVFGLKARRTAMKDRRYAFLKVGEVGGSVIEIVGPADPVRGPLTGQGWGLAFRSGNLDATVRYLRDSGVAVTEPHNAIQGGRIASVPVQLGGVQIAFLGD